MAKARQPSGSPATSPEARESQLVSLAVELAERQLRDGTASPSVITHYLKLGTTRERLEQERLQSENVMLRAKTDQLSSSVRSEELFERAIDAFTSYQSNEADDE